MFFFRSSCFHWCESEEGSSQPPDGFSDRAEISQELWSNIRNHFSTVVRTKKNCFFPRASTKAWSFCKLGPGWYCCCCLTWIRVQTQPFLPKLLWSESLCFEFSAPGCGALKAHALHFRGAIKACGHRPGFWNCLSQPVLWHTALGPAADLISLLCHRLLCDIS